MWSLIPLLVIKTTVIPSKKCPQQLMNTNNFAQAIVITLWIYLILLSILVPLETGRIFIRLLSFGYPARRLELDIPKEKLKTKFPPFVRKPKVAEESAPIDKQTAIQALPLRPTTRTDENSNVYKHFEFRSK